MRNIKIFENEKVELYAKKNCKKCFGNGTKMYLNGKGLPCECLIAVPKKEVKQNVA
jgi:hypothetical protein